MQTGEENISKKFTSSETNTSLVLLLPTTGLSLFYFKRKFTPLKSQ